MNDVKPSDMIHSLQDAGMSHPQIARAVQVDPSSITYYSKLERQPSWDKYLRIQKLYEKRCGS